jgi:hypothetical protein
VLFDPVLTDPALDVALADAEPDEDVADALDDDSDPPELDPSALDDAEPLAVPASLAARSLARSLVAPDELDRLSVL